MDADNIIETAKSEMQKAFDHTLSEFASLNTGKASPGMVDSLPVEAYGSRMKLLEVAAVTTPDVRTIRIQPWDKSVIKAIEKAIHEANIGLNPIIDGNILRCPIPELSRERRQELAKSAKAMAEHGRVGVRGARRDAMDALKKAQKAGDISEDDLKRYEKDVQKLTDNSVADIDKKLAEKEADLMKV